MQILFQNCMLENFGIFAQSNICTLIKDIVENRFSFSFLKNRFVQYL